LQDPTDKHFGDVGILDKYEDNNNNKEEMELFFNRIPINMGQYKLNLGDHL
jgi:hypothetical protein